MGGLPWIIDASTAPRCDLVSDRLPMTLPPVMQAVLVCEHPVKALNLDCGRNRTPGVRFPFH